MSVADTPRGLDAAASAQQMLEFEEQLTPASPLPHQKGAGAAVRAEDDGLLPHQLTDRGNAKLFIRLHKDVFRHVEGLGWYEWADYRWRRGAEKAALWAAGELAEQMPDSDPASIFTDREIALHRRRSSSTAGIKSFLEQAKASPDLSMAAWDLDSDPWALCTPGGVIELRTGELQKPSPFDGCHSRATSVAPEDMPTPRWNRFLVETFGDDQAGREMIDFLHVLLGYSTTGDVGGQVLPFLYGEGKNGKSVLLDVMLQLLGDYADAAPPGFLMDRGAFTEHSTELTELHGRRLLVCSELKATDRFDEARVKLLTGGDKIKARRMRQDYFSFPPTHHLWLLGNHKPEVGTGGFAFWRRIRLVPFEKTVSDENKIDNLALELVRDEGPGILHWVVQGAVRYHALREQRQAGGSLSDPLEGPTRVRLATDAYATTEDTIGRFLTECCTRNSEEAELRVEQGQLYAAYAAWCNFGEGTRPTSKRAFATRVRTDLGLASPNDMVKSNGRKFYPGIGLLVD
ncbi:phage/plasmid primase, P4 family [Kitasatospora sp. GP82]|uniref:DNA primase family protein n=1 Tax=Kitasatospora sp. GP82 TaxID=3035089 RepID=UPI0024731C8C|nr:phage/plasmid primase, P4 family [Kitasatospora sp. GP82]MDH6128797.1 putative DNA primase/helicase [Kitasatospora sp. GP82]